MQMLLFWVVRPCRLAGIYQLFGETYCLHLQGWKMEKCVSPKHWYLSTSLHGVTTQNNNIATGYLSSSRDLNLGICRIRRSANHSIATFGIKYGEVLFCNSRKRPIGPNERMVVNLVLLLLLQVVSILCVFQKSNQVVEIRFSIKYFVQEQMTQSPEPRL
jgi:hypothetical protein